MKTHSFFRITMFILINCLYIGILTAQPTPPSGKKWQTVPELTDNFNSFDGNKWQKGHPYWSGRSPSQFNNNNLSWQNGNLRLKGTLRNANRQGDYIWTACLTSKSRSFKRGMYAEARIRNADMAIVSSFWMQGRFSEIDVIENWGEVKNNRWDHLTTTMEMNTHFFPQPCGFDCDTTTQKHYNDGTSNSGNYNVYGVWWKDNRNIVWYKNGKRVANVTLPYDFNEDMFMFFDMEAFTWGPGLPSNNDLNNNNKNTAYYDWVRTYRLVNGNSNPPPPTGGGSIVALKGNNGLYVSSENGAKAMNCNRNRIGSWEKFEIKTIGSSNGNDIVTLRGNNGKYVSSENGNRPINCNRDNPRGWERFELLHHGNNVYSFKGNNGRYLSSENGTRAMTCTKSSIGDQEKFTIQFGLSRTSNIDEQKSANIQVYPNPASGVLNISGIDKQQTSFAVLNIQGKLLFNKTIESKNGTYTLDINNLAKGLYILKLEDKNIKFSVN